MQNLKNDYCRYFGLKQKVFLILVSEDRNADAFLSLSGFVVSCAGDVVRLNVSSHFEKVLSVAADAHSTYKLTSEYMGCGLQVLGNIIRVEPGTVVTFNLHSDLELFQHRQAPRIDTKVGIYILRRDFSLAFFQKEWSRVMGHMKKDGIPANLVMLDMDVNLSISGIRLATERQAMVNPLSMFFIDIGDGLPPVCVISEMVWDGKDESEPVCAHRFIQIQKADQQRLNNFVFVTQRKKGIVVKDFKLSAHLLDRMTVDSAKPKS